MEDETNLPFKVGDLAEAKSFQLGFRGAWFRCKILEIKKKKEHIQHLLEYYDFPDDKPKWTRLYHVTPSYLGKSIDKPRELMLRPCYPPIYIGKQMPNVNEITKVTVAVHDAWKVGDLVDWFATGCYWSGRITQLLGDGKAQMELKPKPLGEGESYDILLKDIRPSLDWSPENGWTMPTQESDTNRPSARLIKPLNQAPSNSLAASDETKNRGSGNSSISKTSRADTNSGQTSSEPIAEEDLNSSCPLKNSKASEEGTTLRSVHSDTMEAAILDLDEYLNKVKWLKGILESGISSSDVPRSQWEFVDPNAAPSTRR
ncbi:hypothetical protein BUALT_Bualt14G0108200 [Buddleja alternifolia]|uniref:Agenet domain-containing protein n=1 Tax=Buddleja alternifolia TaxID=168488 RepID=A0AAV6WRA6_9LAMI|nr:hypothetical protein BUALT_Bualt14G0108200 [Buddleja alternifolia]